MYCDFAMLKWPLSVALAIVCGFISNKSEIFMVIYPIPATCLYSVLCRVAGISTFAFTSELPRAKAPWLPASLVIEILLPNW